MSLGSLAINLEANILRFTQGMDRAAQQTENAMNRMERSSTAAKEAMIGLAQGAIGALSVGALGALIKGAIDAADNLRDMSQKTGIAVEQLNGLGFAAGQAGGSLESMVAAAGKLNKAISEAAGGGKEQAAAFDVLGISVLDASGNLKKADVVMAEVADKFALYQDGPEKAAIALALFGKAGADMVPLLNDGGDAMRENIAYAEQYSNSTTELSNASDNFNDTMGKLALQQKGFANTMAAAVLPILQAVAEETLNATEQSDKYSLAANAVRTVLETFVVVGSEVAFIFKAVGTEIGGVAAQLVSLANFDLKGFNAISTAMKADAEIAAADHDKFIKRILDRTPATVTADGTPSAKPNAPRLPGKGAADTAAKEASKLAKNTLDGRLKDLEAGLAKEQSSLEFGNKYIAELRNQDQLDLVTYNDYRQRSLESGLAISVKAYDSEIAVLKAYQDSGKKESEKAEAQNKIDELQAKKSKSIQSASNESKLLKLDLSRAQSELNKTMVDWNREQSASADQLQFNNDLIGKSALEIEKLTNARRIELDIEEKIRAAKEKGVITDETIARYRKDGAAQSVTVNKISTQARGDQIGRDQRKPEEIENERHANEIKDLQEYQKLKFENIATGNQRIEEENRRHELAKYEMQASYNIQSVQMAGDAAGQLYGLMQRAGKEQSALGKAVFLASKALAVAEIIMNTEVAAAKAGAQLGIFGIPMATMIRVTGYASAGLVAGMAIAEASAEGGYDIPAGKNPLTQLHEKEMVLPKEQANVIRGLASNGGKGGGIALSQTYNINIDGSTDMAKNQQMIRAAVQQGNAELAERLHRQDQMYR